MEAVKLFERKQKRIILFGCRVWLRERVNKDVNDITVWYKKQKIEKQTVEEDPTLATAFDVFKLTSVADALKDNIWKFRWWWLLFPPMFIWAWRRNRKWTEAYLSTNLTPPQLNVLLEQVWILEGYEPISENGEAEKKKTQARSSVQK